MGKNGIPGEPYTIADTRLPTAEEMARADYYEPLPVAADPADAADADPFARSLRWYLPVLGMEHYWIQVIEQPTLEQSARAWTSDTYPSVVIEYVRETNDDLLTDQAIEISAVHEALHALSKPMDIAVCRMLDQVPQPLRDVLAAFFDDAEEGFIERVARSMVALRYTPVDASESLPVGTLKISPPGTRMPEFAYPDDPKADDAGD